MILVFISMLICLLKPPYKPKLRLVKDIKTKQNMWVRSFKRLETRKKWTKRMIKLNIKIHEKKMSWFKFILYVGSVIKYPHYRAGLYRVARGHVLSRLVYSKDKLVYNIKCGLNNIQADTNGMASWYFSGTGDDTTGDGSVGTPWRSHDKFNSESGSYSAGDFVYFEKGGDYTPSADGGSDTTTQVQTAGSTGNPITITSNGSGALPKMQRISGEASYITLINLAVDNSEQPTHQGIDWSDNNSNGIEITINGCETTGGDIGILFHGSGQFKDVTVTGCTMYQNGSSTGFYMETTNATKATNITFTSCTIDNPGKDGFVFHDGGSFTQHQIEGPILCHTILITNITSYTENIIDCVSGKTGEMYNINLTFNGKGVAYGHSAGYDGGWHIHHCMFVSTTAQIAININAPNLKLYNGLIVSAGRGIQVTDDDYNRIPGAGLNGGYPIDGVECYYLTIIDNNNASRSLFRYTINRAEGYISGGCKVRNCILTTTQASIAVPMVGWTGAGVASFALSDFDHDYCQYYGGSASASFDGFGLSNFASWQSGGQGANSAEGDPKLVDRTGGGTWPTDAKLQSDSPCINNALNIGAGTYYDESGNPTSGITVDYAGTSRATDIGMYEYASGDTPTTQIGLQNQKIMNLMMIYT